MFKRFVVFLLLSVCMTTGVLVDDASAHLAGQAPFFKVNDKFINLYPIQNPDVKKLILPQTHTPENYLPGEDIVFELVPGLMPVTPEAIEQTKFSINLGDGTEAEGISVTHQYKKTGSYFVNVYGDEGGGPVLIEAVIVHIVPQAGYAMPVPKISLNGVLANDPAKNYQANLGGGITLDGADSVASAKIVGYWWDFADGSGGQGREIKHEYADERIFVSPVLRVRDANGLIADSTVDIANDNAATANSGSDDSFSIGKMYDAMNRKMKSMLDKALPATGVNYVLAGLVLLFAAIAGALHSLTPGHGKSVMAALLIGRKRSKRTDIAVVAGAITFTHTIVIFILGFIFLVLDSKMSLTRLTGYLEKVSAVIIIGLAIWLLYSGYTKWRQARTHLQAHKKGVAHEHMHDHQHAHSHDGGHQHDHGSSLLQHHHPEVRDFKGADSKRALFLAGASGGIVPCVDALSLLLLAASLGYTGFGLILVAAFSVGLAASIVAIGLMLLAGKKRLPQEGRLANLATIYAPMVSGVIIFVLAVGLLLK